MADGSLYSPSHTIIMCNCYTNAKLQSIVLKIPGRGYGRSIQMMATRAVCVNQEKKKLALDWLTRIIYSKYESIHFILCDESKSVKLKPLYRHKS